MSRSCRAISIDQAVTSAMESIKQSDIAYPVLVSTFAGLSTTVGGALATIRDPDDQGWIAFLLGIAAGVMASLSLVELYIENGIEHGFLQITVAFIAGGIAFALLDRLVPDFEDQRGGLLAARQAAGQLPSTSQEVQDSSGGSINGAPGGSGGEVSQDQGGQQLAEQAVTAVQTTVVQQRETGGGTWSETTVAEEAGGAVVAANGGAKPSGSRTLDPAETLRLGVLMTITMTLHNFPEGFAVGFSALTDIGPIVALAIAVHNIPEGVIIAAPIFASTRSRAKAIGIATLSGLTEPLGAALSLSFAGPVLSETFIEYMLSFVGGIMTAVCVLELIPEAKACNSDRAMYGGIALGSGVMLWTLYVGV